MCTIPWISERPVPSGPPAPQSVHQPIPVRADDSGVTHAGANGCFSAGSRGPASPAATPRNALTHPASSITGTTASVSRSGQRRPMPSVVWRSRERGLLQPAGRRFCRSAGWGMGQSVVLGRLSAGMVMAPTGSEAAAYEVQGREVNRLGMICGSLMPSNARADADDEPTGSLWLHIYTKGRQMKTSRRQIATEAPMHTVSEPPPHAPLAQV